MVLTNTPISAHDHGTRHALLPRVAPTPYFTCQNWILALVVICDQTGAPVIGTAHEHFIQVRDFECTHRSRSLVLCRLVMNSTDVLPRLRHYATYKPDPQVEQMSTDTSPPPLMVCFALASLALRRPFASATDTSSTKKLHRSTLQTPE